MPRRLPCKSPPPLPAQTGRREPLLDLEIAVVTPLFGGGTTAGQVDRERPVTGQTIRGHLRFWWRACHAPRYATPQALFDAEADIWGSVGDDDGPGPSKIDLTIQIVSPGKQENLRERSAQGRPIWRQGYPDYALFPFQESTVKPSADLCLTNVRFRILLLPARHVIPDRLTALKQDVTNAAWAWITFGGIGARTRRGCGSLWCDHPEFKPPADARKLAAWLRERAGQHVLPGSYEGLQPSLSGARYVVNGSVTKMVEAWRSAVQVMADLRQQRGLARNQGQGNRPGRSRWPEPDSVRELLELNDGRHRPEHPARPAFPRADLGLPILFQQMQGTPTLEPASGSTRMASPVILKPLAVSEERAVPLVLVLNAPHIWDDGAPGVVLKQGGRQQPISREMLQIGENSRHVHPLHNDRYKVTNARDAVLALAADRWNTRAERL